MCIGQCKLELLADGFSKRATDLKVKTIGGIGLAKAEMICECADVIRGVLEKSKEGKSNMQEVNPSEKSWIDPTEPFNYYE